MAPRALVTGIGGQDGSLLAELLLASGYDVVGVVRREPDEYPNLAGIRDRITFVHLDLLDPEAIVLALREVRPDEVYNLASVSFVPASWDDPVATARLAAVGVTALLEAIRAVDPSIRFCQASSSEIFGTPRESPQTEETPLAPVTPYGIAKAYGHQLTRAYRLEHGLHASSAILFNHESPRRPPEFLPRKVSLGVARIKAGLQDELVLGDLDARRDWGYAGDYVRAMWSMCRADAPGDYVVATGRTHTVRELVAAAFAHVGLDPAGHVTVAPSLVRAPEPVERCGSPELARRELGWTPTVSFEDLVASMVDHDLAAVAGPGAAR